MARSPLASKRVSPARRITQRVGLALALLIHLMLLTALGAQAAERPASDRTATLVGHVQPGVGAAAAGYHVVVMPVGVETGLEQPRATVVDANGDFTVEGLPAGRVAVIVSSGDTGALPEAGQVVNLTAGRRNSVTLTTRRPTPAGTAATFNFVLYKGEYYNNKTTEGAADPVSVTAPNTTSNINFDLVTGGGTIAGRVTADGTGAGLKDLVVFAIGTHGFLNSLSFDRTDASGDYRISGVAADSFLVFVNGLFQFGSSEYVGEYYNNSLSSVGATYVKVAEGQNVTGINFGLARGGSISGRVTADAGGAGLEDVQVTATGVAPVGQSLSTVTDATGNYTLTGLIPGSFTLRFETYDDSYVTEYYNNRTTVGASDPVVVTAGNTATANAALAAAGRITGRVTNSSTGAGIPDMTVIVLNVADPFGGTGAITAADGTYSAGGLVTGAYKVGVPEIGKWYDDKDDESLANVVNVTTGVTVPNINLSGVPFAGGCTADPGSRIFIGGRVTSGGQPVEDAEVELYLGLLSPAMEGQIPDRFNIASTSTDADGRYLFDCLDEVTYFVQCTPNVGDYIGQWFDNADSAGATPLAVAVGSSRDDIDFDLLHGARISGRVTTGGSTGVAGVLVNAKNRATGEIFEAFSDNSGNYTIQSGDTGGLPTGTYTVWCDDRSTADLTLLPVTLARFEAVPALGGIALEWQTSEENEHSGFHVYRAEAPNGEAARLTDRLISGGPDYRFMDETVQSDRAYWYWLGAVDRQGREERLGPVTASFGTPAVSKLLGVFPNPLHAQSVIHFSLATAGKARVQIFDPSGRLVRTLADADYPTGRASVTWDGLTEDGSSARAGVYFVQFTAGVARGTAKVIVAR